MSEGAFDDAGPFDESIWHWVELYRTVLDTGDGLLYREMTVMIMEELLMLMFLEESLFESIFWSFLPAHRDSRPLLVSC